MPPDEILYSPALLAVLGLCIGSFLNVVVHRLPADARARLARESAELLGVPAPETPPDHALDASLALSRRAPCDRLVREHPARQLALAARPLLGVQDADLGALSGRRRSRRRRSSRRSAGASAPRWTTPALVRLSPRRCSPRR
jgi:hypothetical protein